VVLSDTTNMPALFAKHPNWHGVIDAARCLRRRLGADCSTVPCPTRRSLLATTSVSRSWHDRADGTGYTFAPSA